MSMDVAIKYITERCLTDDRKKISVALLKCTENQLVAGYRKFIKTHRHILKGEDNFFKKLAFNKSRRYQGLLLFLEGVLTRFIAGDTQFTKDIAFLKDAGSLMLGTFRD